MMKIEKWEKKTQFFVNNLTKGRGMGDFERLTWAPSQGESERARLGYDHSVSRAQMQNRITERWYCVWLGSCKGEISS